MTKPTERPRRPPTVTTAPQKGGAPSRRHQAEQVRTQILAVAQEHFRRYGYDRTSLAEIGATLGLTRGAVLYYFGTKAQLLAVVLQPFMTGLDDALAELESRTSPPRPATVIDTVLALLLETRTAADLLARDIASRHALNLDTWFTTNAARLVALLAPTSSTDPAAEARGYATLGAMIRPLAQMPDPLPEPARHATRRAALNALRPPPR